MDIKHLCGSCTSILNLYKNRKTIDVVMCFFHCVSVPVIYNCLLLFSVAVVAVTSFLYTFVFISFTQSFFIVRLRNRFPVFVCFYTYVPRSWRLRLSSDFYLKRKNLLSACFEILVYLPLVQIHLCLCRFCSRPFYGSNLLYLMYKFRK